MQYMDRSCWESTEFGHDLGIQPKKAWSEVFHTHWIGSEWGCYHWYVRPSSYMLTPFSHFWGKEGGESFICFLLCPWTTRRRPPLVLLAKSGRIWRALLVLTYIRGKKEKRKKNSTRLFERSPSSYICKYHWTIIKRKEVILNCRRVPTPQSTNNNMSPSPHHVFPFCVVVSFKSWDEGEAR